MTQMNDTLLRQWAMLRHIPRHPRKTDTATLQAKLAEDGYTVTRRSIQRDLVKLSIEFPLISDGAKAQGWSWHADASQLDIPALDPHTALTFRLAEAYLRPLLPESTLAHLQPWFHTAAGVLDATRGNGAASWPEKIRVLPNGQPLQSPTINAAAQATLYQALLQDKRATVRYRPRYGSGIKDYVVNPLALVVRDQLVYLLCTLWDYQDVLQLALHRIENAQLLDEAAIRPSDFNVDAYIGQGKFGYVLSEQPLQLEAEFTRQGAIHLAECPLSDDQSLTELGDDKVLVRATVPDTEQLRWWLRAFGDGVTVLAPASLRDEFRQMAQRQAERYAEDYETTS